MNTDIRISVNFFEHPKTTRLKKQLGPESIVSLLTLWTWAAKNRPDGILTNLTDDDVEAAAQWDGEPGIFVNTLVKLRFLDNDSLTVVNGRSTKNNDTERRYVIHDWRSHNPWASEANARSDKARFSRLAYVCPEIHSQLLGKGQDSITKEEYEQIKSKIGRINNRKNYVS